MKSIKGDFNLDHELDQTSGRVWIAICSGAIAGASQATLRGMQGIRPLLRTSASVAASWALVGTACFGMERVAFHLVGEYGNLQPLRTVLGMDSHSLTGEEEARTMESSVARDKVQLGVSHILGGIGGGAITGGLFQGRPFFGAASFVPLMCGVAFLEMKWDDYREARLKALLLESRNYTKNGEKTN